MVEVAQATQNREQARLATVTADSAEQDAYLALITAMGIRRWRSRASPRCPITRCRPRWRSRSNRSSPTRWRAGPTCWLPMRPSRPKGWARAADSDFLPKVFLSASTSHTRASSITAVPAIGQQAGTVNLDGSRSGSSVFLGVTLPLYDGGLLRGGAGCRRATTPPAPANA